MNKKFLSAILFGALMVSSTGTFVSCKDYDDDIDQINNELAGIKSQIAALESKIGEGKWITSVTPTANGFTITLSDNQTLNITNGKDGEAGKPGTEWTISEDGFWVCDGVKTEVKAVGMDGAQGEPGKDAQQEVKFENGKWLLWNGTEFVEFKAAEGAATNVPFYYTDPNDQNYKILVFFDKDGKNPYEVRMPMNAGLAQINILDDSKNVWVSFHKYTGTKTWEGDKALPAQGEYLVVQPVKEYLIQVTPANYDMSDLKLKLVNAAGKEAPVKLGAPTPFKGDLPVQGRAVSESGIYSVSVELKDYTAATLQDWKENFKGQGLSLVANESVRSTYEMALTLQDPTTDRNYPKSSNIVFGNSFNEDNTFKGAYYNLNEDSEIFLTPYVLTDNNHIDIGKMVGENYIYDAFITVSNDADSIKAGMTTEGLKVVIKNEISNSIKYTVHYVDAKGHIYKTTEKDLIVNKYVAPDTQFGEIELAKASHQSTTKVADQYQLIDLKAYFDKFAATEEARILWNADAILTAGATGVYENDPYATVKATWEHVNADGDVVTEDASNLISNYTFVNDKGEVKGNGEATKIKVNFENNYGSTVTKFEDGTLKLYATVTVKGNDDTDAREQHTIVMPIEIKNLTAAEVAAAVKFDAAFYKDGVYTVLNNNQVDITAIVISNNVSYNKDTKLTTGIEWVDEQFTTVKLTQNVGELGKEYAISGGIAKVMNRDFPAPTFSVKFVQSADYKFSFAKDLAVVCDGNEINVKNGEIKYKDGKPIDPADNIFFTWFKVVDFAGKDANGITFTIKETNANGQEITTGKLLQTVEYKVLIAAVENDPSTSTDESKPAVNGFYIKSAAGRIANDITTYVTVTCTVDNETVTATIPVTIKASI